MNSTVNKEELKKFASLHASWWDKDGELRTLHDINPTRLNYITSFIDLENKEILDVGCGGGILTEALAHLNAKVSGLDAEQKAIEIAKAHCRDIKYYCQTIEQHQAQPYDIITCMELLEHVDNVAEVISNCRRLLKDDGLLFLSTFNRTTSAYLFGIIGSEYILNLLPRQTHDYKKFIKPSELARVLAQHDFEIIDIKGLGYNPLKRQAFLQDSVAVNYMMCCKKVI